MYEPLPGQLPNPMAGQRQLSPQAQQMISEVEGAFSRRDDAVDADVDRSIEKARRDGTSPKAVIGSTPAVSQPDSRVVPAWAAGVAVASIGVGAGSTGLGCAAWLLFRGLSLVSVPSLERFAWIIITPFAGLAMVLTVGGSVISKAKKTAPREIHNHMSGPVYQDQSTTETKTKNFSVTAKTTNNPKE